MVSCGFSIFHLSACPSNGYDFLCFPSANVYQCIVRRLGNHQRCPMLSLPIISSIHVRIYIYTPTLIGHRRWWMVATAIRIFLCYWHFSWWNVASQHQAAKSQPQRQHVHPSFGGMLLQPGGSDSRNPKPNSSQFQHIPTNGLSSTSLKTKKKITIPKSHSSTTLPISAVIIQMNAWHGWGKP